jgi:hypothetical protein
VPDWQYYLSGESPEAADEGRCGLTRTPVGGPASLAEMVTPAGGWLPDDGLWKNLYQGDDDPYVPIESDRAEQLMARWVEIGRLAKVPSGESTFSAEEQARLIEADRRAAQLWRDVPIPPGAADITF